jgi:fatty-acid desaturase
VLAPLVLGEGWHNNHHRDPSSARHGSKWWEIDVTYYAIWALSQFGAAARAVAVAHGSADEHNEPTFGVRPSGVTAGRARGRPRSRAL